MPQAGRTAANITPPTVIDLTESHVNACERCRARLVSAEQLRAVHIRCGIA